MKIDVSELLRATGNDKHIDFSFEASYPEDDLEIVGPIKGEVGLLNTGETILLRGKIFAKVRLKCVRCLTEFVCPLQLAIEEQYAKKHRLFNKKKREIELSENDFIFGIAEDNTIDLSEAIRQNLITALPIKPLCNAKCSGIRR